MSTDTKEKTNKAQKGKEKAADLSHVKRKVTPESEQILKHQRCICLAAIVSVAILLSVAVIYFVNENTVTLTEYTNNVGERSKQMLRDLKNKPCGDSIEYWSDSCGPILSVMSRTCSRGGVLANEDSCTSHFEPGSQGCGFIKLGCRSRCVAKTAMCHTGHPRFIAPEYHSLASDDTFPVWIERVDGKNGILKAVLKFCGRDDDSGHTVLWENGDNGPRMVQMPNTRKGDKGERALCLARLGGGTSMNQGTTALVQIHDSLDHDMVQFGETRLTARESDATLRISVHRIRRDSTETPNTHSIDKEKVETLNTHATDKEKAETRKTHATDKEKKKTPNEPSRRPLNVTIVHSGGNALSSIDFQPIFPYEIEWTSLEEDTVEVEIPLLSKNLNLFNVTIALHLLVNDKFVAKSTAVNVVADVTLENVDTEETLYEKYEHKFAQYEELGNIVGLPRDLNIRNQFFKNFQYLKVPANTRLFGDSELMPGVVVVAEGALDVYKRMGSVTEAEATPDNSTGNVNTDWRKYKRVSIHTKSVKGTLIGLATFLTSRVAPKLRAITKRDSELWIASGSSMRHFATEHPEIMKKIHRKSLRTKMQNVPYKPPILFFPGFMSSRLVAWKYKYCPTIDINPLDVMWVSLERMAEVALTDPRCYLNCLGLGPNQTDPHDCVVRAMEGMAALTELSPGVMTEVTTIYGSMIRFLVAKYGYNAMHILGMPYDWRLSPDQLDERDGYWVTTKKRIEAIVHANKMPAIAVGHSQGNIVLLHFMRWLEHTYPKTWKTWVKEHINSYYGLGAPLLGSVDPVRGLMTGNNMGLPFSHALAKNMAMTFGTMPWFTPHHGNASHVSGQSRANEIRPHGQWLDPVTTVIWPNKSRTEYNQADLLSTKFHADMRDSGEDLRWQNQINIVENNYNNKPINNFADGYSRPPIKHVYMLYGVDWDTPIQETYQKRANITEPVLVAVHDETSGGVVRNRFTGESKGHTGYQRSGDATVPYVSLSWANLWHHNTSKIEQQTVAARVIEFYDHPIGKWGERTVFSLMNVNEPEYQIYYSKHKNGDDGDIHFTSVYEIKGGECQHRNIVKDPFIHKLIGQTLLDDLKMDYETPNLEDDTKAANRKISDMRLRHDADGMDDDMGMSLEE